VKVVLYLIVDVSGSMSEGGKHLIARGVVLAIAQYLRLGYGSADLRMVAWSKEARVVEWMLNKELPVEMLVCEKAANAKALITLLGEQPDGKVLLITDGFWSRDDAKALKYWNRSLQQDTLRIIKIGADASSQLKGSDVFAADELFAALEGWLDGDVA
jgi:uncharacterized protein with von Willebrand factor type A (vWA) domain